MDDNAQAVKIPNQRLQNEKMETWYGWIGRFGKPIIVIRRIMTDFNFEQLYTNLVEGNRVTSMDEVRKALEAGKSFREIYNKAIVPSINEVIRL